MEPSDETLVLTCRSGDAAAWEMLVLRYKRLIYTIATRAGLDQEQASEVLQHVFTRLVENLDRIQQPGQVNAWLVTTARREALLLRRRERAVDLSTEEHRDRVEDIPDAAALPDDLLLRIEQQQKVRAALAALDPRCRMLLTLLFYRPDTPSYSEIAAALGMSEGSVGPIRARCLQKLRRLLDAIEP